VDSGRLSTVGQSSGVQLIGLPFPVVERMTDEMNSIDAVAASNPT
jgi:hypothetical protein